MPRSTRKAKTPKESGWFFGQCHNCAERCQAPPIKIPIATTFTWSKTPGQVEVDYATYCTKTKCAEAAVKEYRKIVKARVKVSGTPVKTGRKRTK